MAHIGRNNYSHIHYDLYAARVISVREAARLQLIPRWVPFLRCNEYGLPTDGYVVPPLLAWRLAQVMLAAIRAAVPKPVRLRKGRERTEATGPVCSQIGDAFLAALAGVCGKVQHGSTRLLRVGGGVGRSGEI